MLSASESPVKIIPAIRDMPERMYRHKLSEKNILVYLPCIHTYVYSKNGYFKINITNRHSDFIYLNR